MPEQKNVAPKSLVYRAVFVANHPYLGRAVLCRTLFQRRVLGIVPLSALDECGPKKSLYETAKSAVARVFPGHPITLYTGTRFKRIGVTGKVIKATVYHLDAPHKDPFLSLEDAAYIPLEQHPLHQDIAPAVKDIQLPSMRLRMG